MRSDIVFSNLCLNWCLRFGCYLDIVMLLLLGDTFLMVRFVSIVLGLPGSCIWRGMIWWHLTFSDLSHIRCHIGAYFRSDEICRSRGSCALILICEMYVEMMIYSLSSRWFLSGAYREPSSRARAFRCLDVVMLPSEGRLFDVWVWFGCRHRWFGLICVFSTCYILDATLGHIPPFRSRCGGPPLICMIIPSYEIYVRLMIRLHFVLILRGASLESFNQILTLWYSRGSWTKLCWVPGFPRHHFSGVHIRSFAHPHVLFSGYQDRSGTSDSILGHISLI